MKLIKLDVNNQPNYPFYNNLECDDLRDSLDAFEDYLNSVDCVNISLWCAGSSGMFLATVMLCRCTKKDVTIRYVRKEGETTHDYGTHKFANTIKLDCKNIIIDDFMCTGITIVAIHKAMVDEGIIIVDCLLTTSRFRGEALRRFKDRYPVTHNAIVDATIIEED